MPQSVHPEIQDDDPRHHYHDLVVAEVIRETEDASSFVFDVPPEMETTFRYVSGQFLTFRIPWEGFEIQRCYSLSSAQGWDDALKVTVKRVEDGRMSNWMNDRLAPGDRIHVLPPAGIFVLHETRRPLALFCGGSGVTPVISILKAALRDTSRRIQLVYANRDPASVIFRAELDDMARQHADRLSVVHHLDSDSGFLATGDIERLASGWLDADFYICGPAPFMDTVEEALQRSPLQGGDIHVERFVSAVDPDRKPAETAAAPAGATPGRAVVFLDRDQHEVAYEAGETLLGAVLRAGLDAPFSCQDGYCGCCMARLKRGKVKMASTDALSRSDIESGLVLACQSVPQTSECEIDFEDV